MSLLSMLFGTAQNSAVKVLSAEEFKAQIGKGKVQLADVRTPGEFNSGHIKNAKNIDFFTGSFADKFEKLSKEKPVYLYCRSGARSKKASNKLVTMGFTEIYDLKGGYNNWK
ncbi:rhodanese-like domain-containing protein [Bizionia argentinensis JUB59]|uniref:Rhodanese-like domain-containing protein n=1 Tax=Bizionia argentinensis JUB59 TaxID=1046627 RepID=G2EDT6_9FLAO|nr:rhodanese-like domain-containing protein [Bizionia argentinensis]EGV43401.1 rhodanese-like domain-containing protein [Bizionia argentinensis JUB59]